MKKGDPIVRKEDFCRNGIFFVAEGDYAISDISKKSLLYGEHCFISYA